MHQLQDGPKEVGPKDIAFLWHPLFFSQIICSFQHSFLTVLSGISLFLSCFMRYAYLPQVAVLVAIILLFAFVSDSNNKVKYYKLFLINGITLAVLFSFFFFFRESNGDLIKSAKTNG